jgi:hypothetical protein
MKKGSKHTEQTKEQMSEAKIGNTNAEVWTLEEAEKLFDKALSMVDEEELYIIAGGIKTDGYKYDFIGELVRDLKNDYKEKKVYRYLLNTHLLSQFPQLKKRYEELLNALETNCYFNTKKGIINTAVGIVNLKSNHKWTDRVDNTTKDKPIESNKVVNLIFKNKRK